jgi:hypothetical protein
LHRAAYLNTDDDNNEEDTSLQNEEYNVNSLINNFLENYHKKI